MEDHISEECAVLLLTGDDLDGIVGDLSNLLNIIIPRESSRNRLLVWIESAELDTEKYQNWHEMHKLLTSIYVRAAEVKHQLDKLLFGVDVVLRRPGRSSWSESRHSLGLKLIKVYYKQSDNQLEEYDPDSVPTIDFTPSIDTTPIFGSTDTSSQYPVVAMGGTFDHLHAGHKILLSCAAFLTTTKLIVGITSDTLLTNKKYPEELESLEVRTSKTREFLKVVKPGIELDLPPLTDVYGPTGWDPNIQALVVSKETISGANAIAKRRSEKDLPPLQKFVIDVIAPNGVNLTESEDLNMMKELKISSTAIRQYIVENNSKLKRVPSYTPRGRREPQVWHQNKPTGGSGSIKK